MTSFESLEQINKKPEEEIKLKRKNDIEAETKIRKTIDIDGVEKKFKYPFNSVSLIESLARLTIELEDKITDYDSILSDETSGRLPSLLLRKIINKKRQELGKSNIQIFFLAVEGLFWTDQKKLKMQEFLTKKKLDNVLIVTEYIASGDHIKYLISLLENLNINFDIAAVVIKYKPENYDKKITDKLYYGRASGSSPSLYHAYRQKGVQKSRSESGLDSIHPQKVNYFKEQSFDIAQARKDINILAEELLKLLSEKK